MREFTEHDLQSWQRSVLQSEKSLVGPSRVNGALLPCPPACWCKFDGSWVEKVVISTTTCPHFVSTVTVLTLESTITLDCNVTVLQSSSTARHNSRCTMSRNPNVLTQQCTMSRNPIVLIQQCTTSRKP